MQQSFPTDRQVLAGKFPNCFEDKRTRFSYVFLQINQIQTTYDLVKYFPRCLQSEKRTNKKTKHEVLLLMQTMQIPWWTGSLRERNDCQSEPIKKLHFTGSSASHLIINYNWGTIFSYRTSRAELRGFYGATSDNFILTSTVESPVFYLIKKGVWLSRGYERKSPRKHQCSSALGTVIYRGKMGLSPSTLKVGGLEPHSCRKMQHLSSSHKWTCTSGGNMVQHQVEKVAEETSKGN